jgi:hypothetical protein
MQLWIGLDAPFRVRWVTMRVGSINAVKLVEASDLVAILDEVDGRGYISTTIIIHLYSARLLQHGVWAFSTVQSCSAG